MAPSGLSTATPPANRVEFETLLSDISARLIVVGPDQVEQAVLSALEAVRLFFQADRCALCAVADDLETIRFSHLVYTDGVSNLFGDLNLALLFPWTRQRVAVERAPLVLARLADLPPEAAVDRATFEARGTRAILCLPIQTGLTRLDLFLVSVVREEREWPEEYVPRLRLLGEMLVNTLERTRASEHARDRAIRLAAAVDAAELGFVERLPETGQLYLDSRARDLLGVDAEDSDQTWERWLARIDTKSRPEVTERRRRMLAGEIEHDTTEYRYHHPRRGPIWLRHSWRRVEGDGGQGARVIGALEDVTERKAYEETLRTSEEVNRATFEQAAVGIAHVGADGRWLRVNDRLCAIVGYTREELLGGMTFQDITHPEDLEKDLDFVHQVLGGRLATYTMEKRHFRKGGALIWINLTVSLVRDGAGQPKHFIAVVEDITDRKRAEAALSKTLADVADRAEFATLLSDISARLIAVEPAGVDEAVESALEAVRLYFGVDRCGVLAVSDDKESWRVAHAVYGEGVPRVSGDIDLARLYPWVTQRVISHREPAIVSSLAAMPPEAAVDRASCEAMGIRSFVNMPIKVGSTRLHLIVLNALREEREWPEQYVPRLRLLGEMLVNALERAKASERAREQADRVSAAVDATQLGLGEWTAEEKRPHLDARLCDLLGIGAEELAEARARVDEETRRTMAENHRRLLAGEIERATLEYRYDHPRRGPIWLRQSSRRVEGEGGRGARIIEAVEDVTERRQALEDVLRLRERLEHENVYLRQEAGRRLGLERIQGRGPAIRRTLALAEHVAATDSTVLLLGETGSGKERFASYIHELSRRHDRPMISVNCSGIPASLIESELFGREKGAYTGALARQAGRFELAHGSTLFLDEIGDLPLEVQVKLLRVLENRTIERLGNPRPISIDVRIVAATHRDLVAAVRDGRFREDLYYRLNVFPITVPPLRERREDIPLLIQGLVDQLAATMGRRVRKVDSASVEALIAYPWPGNVRELRNVVERAMILSSAPVLQIDPPETRVGEAASRTNLTAVERTHILQVLQDTGWRIRGAHGAAARLGLKPTTLESRLKKLGLTRPGT